MEIRYNKIFLDVYDLNNYGNWHNTILLYQNVKISHVSLVYKVNNTEKCLILRNAPLSRANRLYMYLTIVNDNFYIESL